MMMIVLMMLMMGWMDWMDGDGWVWPFNLNWSEGDFVAKAKSIAFYGLSIDF